MALGSEPSVEAVRAFLAATDGGARAHPTLKKPEDRSYESVWMPLITDGSLFVARNTRQNQNAGAAQRSSSKKGCRYAAPRAAGVRS